MLDSGGQLMEPPEPASGSEDGRSLGTGSSDQSVVLRGSFDGSGVFAAVAVATSQRPSVAPTGPDATALSEAAASAQDAPSVARDEAPPPPRGRHGVGLTPRLFKSIIETPDATIEAHSAAYVPIVNQHVQAVAPSKQVRAQYWCPMILEEAGGERQVLHVDPIAIRKFRRKMAEDLQHVQLKRHRMMERMRSLRKNFPKALDVDVAATLQGEIADAEAKLSGERVLAQLPPGTQHLQVLVESSAHMAQLGLVTERLATELLHAAEEVGVQWLSLEALLGSRPRKRARSEPQPLKQIDCNDPTSADLVLDWLEALAECAPTGASLAGRAGSAKKKAAGAKGYKLAGPLREATTASALAGGGAVTVLVTCTQPADLEVCVGLVRRSDLVLRIVGVFGTSPEDPENGLRQLADAAYDGSSLELFFGPKYWNYFISTRRRTLEKIETRRREQEHPLSEVDEDDGDVVSAKAFEARLIERIMRECYVEEQLCEEELTCATRLLNRTVVEPEDIHAVLRASGGTGSRVR